MAGGLLLFSGGLTGGMGVDGKDRKLMERMGVDGKNGTDGN